MAIPNPPTTKDCGCIILDNQNMTHPFSPMVSYSGIWVVIENVVKIG